jgi:hypothetical protein
MTDEARAQAQVMTEAIAFDIRLGCYDPGVCLGDCTACKRADFVDLMECERNKSEVTLLEQQKRIEAALKYCEEHADDFSTGHLRGYVSAGVIIDLLTKEAA